MWLFIIIGLAVFVVAVWYLFSAVFGRGEELDPPRHEDIIAHNAAAVAEGRYDDVRFELATRGYRQDQVDDVLRLLTGRVDSGEGANESSSGLE